MFLRSKNSVRPGPSRQFLRLLRGEINAKTYCEYVRRAARISVRRDYPDLYSRKYGKR